MKDTALAWLAQIMTEDTAEGSLWCSDENVLTSLPATSQWAHKPSLMTNRWDVAQQARQSGFESQFSDFDFSEIRDASLTRVFRSEEHTSELQSRENLVCRLLLEK